MTEEDIQAARDHLYARDRILRPVIERAGLCTIRGHQNYYQSLTDSIIGQQLSVKAASTIERRFRELFDNTFPTPAMVIGTPHETLRTAGLSNAKASYIIDLAQRIEAHDIHFELFHAMTNHDIVHELTTVKGIGEWTAHMFLIFCMGRLDVLPTGDLGIRSGIRALYGLTDLPTPKNVQEIAASNQWHPYASVASWYIWHSLDNAPIT